MRRRDGEVWWHVGARSTARRFRIGAGLPKRGTPRNRGMVAREQCGQDATGSAALRSYPSSSTALALRVWGMPDWLTATLGRDFSLGFEEGVVLTRFSSSAAAWDAYTEGFGPVRAVAQALDE